MTSLPYPGAVGTGAREDSRRTDPRTLRIKCVLGSGQCLSWCFMEACRGTARVTAIKDAGAMALTGSGTGPLGPGGGVGPRAVPEQGRGRAGDGGGRWARGAGKGRRLKCSLWFARMRFYSKVPSVKLHVFGGGINGHILGMGGLNGGKTFLKTHSLWAYWPLFSFLWGIWCPCELVLPNLSLF